MLKLSSAILHNAKAKDFSFTAYSSLEEKDSNPEEEKEEIRKNQIFNLYSSCSHVSCDNTVNYSAYSSCLNKPHSKYYRPKLTMLFYYLKVPPHSSLLGPTLALNGALK